MTDEEKRAAMRALTDEQRREAIEAADNVVGHDRFSQRSKQVELRGAYRKPKTPGPGGQA